VTLNATVRASSDLGTPAIERAGSPDRELGLWALALMNGAPLRSRFSVTKPTESELFVQSSPSADSHRETGVFIGKPTIDACILNCQNQIDKCASISRCRE
jgi:hypothetical protein